MQIAHISIMQEIVRVMLRIANIRSKGMTHLSIIRLMAFNKKEESYSLLTVRQSRAKAASSCLRFAIRDCSRVDIF